MKSTNLSITLLAFASGAFSISPARAQQEDDNRTFGCELDIVSTVSRGVLLRSGGTDYREIRSVDTSLALNHSFPIHDRGFLGVGLRLQRTTFSTANDIWSAPAPRRLNLVGLELSGQLTLTPKWQGTLSVTPGWRNAGTHSFSNDGFGATVVALGIYEVNPALRVALGIAGDTLAVGSNRVLPIVGLDWQAAPRWRVRFGVPSTGLFFDLSDSVELGLVAEADFITYSIGNDVAMPLIDGRSITDTKVEYLDARAGISVNVRFSTTASLSLTAGVVGARRFEFPEEKLVVKSKSIDGGYISGSFSLRF